MKNQLKKSLSLFMAVLMVLSCWVWVAPQKAEAANPVASDKYTVTIGYNVTDPTSKSGAYFRIRIYTVKNNGTAGEEVCEYTDHQDFQVSTAGNKEFTLETEGFPIYFGAMVYSGSGTGDKLVVDFNMVKIGSASSESYDICQGKNHYSLDQEGGNSAEKSFVLKGYTGESDDAKTELEYAKPAIAGFVSATANTDPVTMTLKELNGGNATASVPGITYGTYVDQYGVKWTGSTDTFSSDLVKETYVAKTKDSTSAWDNDYLYYDDTEGSATKDKIVATPDLQVEETQTDGIFDGAYIVHKWTCKNIGGGTFTSTVSSQLKITYPQYTVRFDGGGSVDGLDYDLEYKEGGAVATTGEAISEVGPYGKSFTKVPTGTAVALDENGNTAYTFKGLWTEPQPSTGLASYNAKAAEFAEPKSTTDFQAICTKVKDTDGDKYVEDSDGKTYYNAGEQWDPTNNKFTGSEEYYGWWLSKDLTIKFYDIDGAFLDSIGVKYGQNNTAFEWPEVEPTYTNESGSFEYSNFTGKWSHINGEEVDQNNYTFTHDLVLTPKYDTVKFNDKYVVNFINPNNGNNLGGSGTYSYREDIGSKKAADQTAPTDTITDLNYSYSFEGWTTTVPTTGKNYHVMLEESDFDVNGTSIILNNDWIVRSNTTYYPVYRRHVMNYLVKFIYNDATGNEVFKQVSLNYGDTLTPPTDFVPYKYAKEGYEYTFDKWQYTDGKNATAKLDYNASLKFDEDNISITAGALNDGVDVEPIVIKAVYGEGVSKPYTVTFKYVDDEGKEVITETEVENKAFITQEAVNTLSPADEWEHDNALYTFADEWKVTEGASDKEVYATDELTSFSPTSHITFEAVYDNPRNFYNVTYVDGSNTYSERVLEGLNIPEWTYKSLNDNGTPDDADDDYEEDKLYVPEDYESETGTYKFVGWFDEAQADPDCAVTNGKEYTTADAVTGDLTLYSQFKFEPYKFLIEFMDYTGEVQLAAGQYEVGQNFGDAFYRARKAAQSRPADETYTYTFIGWDQPYNEDNLVCEGKAVTYIAQYKPSYIYYKANWYENEAAMTGDPLAVSKHTYNSKVYAPSVSLTPAEGKAFDGWYYKDTNGEEQSFVRGMQITSDMNFYAKYKDAAITYTVTTVVGTAETEYTVAKDETAKVISDPNAGYIDENKHNKFDGWYTDASYTNEFDIENTKITADIKIYAKFTESEHDFSNKEIIDVPTYYVEGKEASWCSCDSTKTRKETKIDMLSDTVAPTGTIYLGTQGRWSSTDAVGAAATDGDEVKYFANADTDLILTVNDTGDVDNAFNPSGLGKGISVIQGFISKGVYSQDNTNVEMSEVIKIFEDTTENLNNVANYVIKLGEYEGLEEGATYVAYYFVRDKAGNVLNTKVRTAKFIYDNTAPAFTVEGDSNAATVNGTPTYCKEATVTGVEAGATLTVNGKSVELTAGTGTYTITEAGNYLVTVTDKAGNKTSKKFQLIADHNYDVKEVLSTCTEDGYKTEICLVCGDEKEKVTYPSAGHEWTISHVPATCTENGYTYKHCEVCGAEEKIYEVGGELIDPAHDHIYDMDGNEIIYTVVTEPTCKTKGKEIATCKACGETITREIAIDENAHSWGATKTLKPTCTEAGKTYHTCKLCYISKDIDTLAATGHKETQWVVTKAATCGEAGVETLQCKKCKAYVDGDDEDTEIDTREIPATGRHILKAYENTETFWVDEENGSYKYILDEDENKITKEEDGVTYYNVYKTFDATADNEGQITRYCTQCGQEWTEKVDKIKKYTVKFVDEDGTEIKTISDVISGTTIEKEAVTEPTKANSGDGKYKYSFAGWVKLVTNEDGTTSDGDAVTLPIDVTEDITLKATYAQSTIIYTHQFKVPNTWIQTLDTTNGYDLFATMMGAMGDSRVPVSNPTFKHYDEKEDAKLKLLYTFEFKYWANEKGEKVDDFTIAGDATFYAVFEAKAIEYQVIYYNGADYVWDTKVEGGMPVTFGGTIPTKDPDGDYHYAFNTWFTDEDCEEGTEYVVKHDETTGELEKGAITALTRLYAGFTATKHNWEKDPDSEANKAATCDDPAEVAYKCAECSATKVDIEGEKLGHTEATKTETVDDITYSVVYCTVCEKELRRTQTSVTVKFNNYNGVRLATKNLNIGDAITYSGETPEKATDAQFTYEFIGWYVEGDENKDLVTLGAATADVTYVAEFKAITRVFRVTYVDAKNNTLQTTEGIAYGSAIPAFTGTIPTKEYDDIYHYTFDKWSVATDAKVTSDLVIQPVFNRTKHNYVDIGTVAATCTEKGGTKKKCSGCDSNYIAEGTVAALGHDFVQINRVEPDYDKQIDGYIEYACSRCDVTDKKVLSAALIEIKVVVKDTNGVAREGIRVDLYVLNTETLVDSKNTDANGEAKFYVKPGDYEARVDGKKTYLSVDKDGTVEGNGKVEVEPEVKAPDCSCTCHKTSFWGILFRLFHKFIKLFTGRIICCDNPDAKYYK